MYHVVYLYSSVFASYPSMLSPHTHYWYVVHEHSHGHANAHGRERAIRQVNALRKAWPELFDEDSTIAMDYACGTGTYFP